MTDRGYAKFTLFNQIVAADSSYVCRLRDNSVWTVIEENYRNDDAILDEIISDEIVEFSKGSGLNHKVRVICIRINPHTSRGKYRGGSSGIDSDGILRIATNLVDVPAEVIGLISRGNILSLFQAHTGQPALAESRSERHRDPDLLCVHADRIVDRKEADASHLRDDLLLFHRPSRRGRANGAHQKMKSQDT